MLLFTGCSVLSTAACTGFVPHVNQTGTSCKFCWTKLIQEQAGICTLACMGTSLSSGCAVAAISVFCCLPVVVVAAACRVCAACPHSQVKDATGCKICLTEPTHTNRCTSECLHDVRLKLFSRSLLLSAGCCAIAAGTGFVQHLDSLAQAASSTCPNRLTIRSM
jgi:hypothetical protein